MTQKYTIIYADPPWLYDDARTKASAGMARSAYECLKVEDICTLPVACLAAPQSLLALWATGPKMPEAMQVVRAWGFKYLTVGFTWVKRYADGSPYSGLGWYTKSGTEFVLFARKGDPLPRLDRTVRQIIDAPVRRHSAKPDEVRDRLVRLFGDVPRIELFARTQTPGWDVWGDEVPSIPLGG